MGEVPGIRTSLKLLVAHDIINFLYVQDLILAGKMKMKKKSEQKRETLINVKKF